MQIKTSWVLIIVAIVAYRRQGDSYIGVVRIKQLVKTRRPPFPVSGQLGRSQTFERQRYLSSHPDGFFQRLFCPRNQQSRRAMMVVIDLPSPPLKESFHPGLRHWTWGVLEELHNVVPEYLIVEVPINGAPGRDVRKCKTDLRNWISAP